MCREAAAEAVFMVHYGHDEGHSLRCFACACSQIRMRMEAMRRKAAMKCEDRDEAAG